MSFGKDDGHLRNIGTYGATTSQQMGNATRRQSGPRKGGPSWANNYQPSFSAPDTIRLIPGDFEAERIDKNTGNVFMEKVPWFEFTEHFHGGIKKSITCSGGVFRMSDRKKAAPCRGCDIWREDADERRRIERETGHKPAQPDRMSFSGKYAFICLDTGWFFKGYRYDENGRVKVSDKGQPYMDWMKYNDANYQYYTATQRDLAQQNKAVETQAGLIRPWPVGYTQFNLLIGFSDMIQKHCKNCGGMNCIHTQAWVCPSCQTPTFVGNETTMPEDKIKEVVNAIVTCRNCRQPGYPRAIQSCQHCSNPTPSSIYDVDLSIQAIKVGKNTTLHLAGVSAPKPIDGQFAELMKKLPDLPTKFAPTPYDQQIAIFGAGPQMGVAQQQGFGQPQGYGQPQGFGTPQQPYGSYGAGQPQYNHVQSPGAPQQPPAQPYAPPGFPPPYYNGGGNQ